MTLKEKIIEVLNERAFEHRDGATTMLVVEDAEFDQVAIDILQILQRDYGLEISEDETVAS